MDADRIRPKGLATEDAGFTDGSINRKSDPVFQPAVFSVISVTDLLVT